MKNKNLLIIILIIIIAILAGFYYYKNNEKNNIKNENNIKTNANTSTMQENSTNITQTNEDTKNITSQNIKNITKEEAEKILEKKFGIKDELTGNTMSYAYLTMVKDKDGNQYYAFRESWLVDNSHMPFLQNAFVSIDGKTIKTTSEPAGYEENQVVTFDEEQ